MSKGVEPYIQINELINKYDFPIAILKDVRDRLRDSDDPQYAEQQVRYLKNIVSAGLAQEKDGAI